MYREGVIRSKQASRGLNRRQRIQGSRRYYVDYERVLGQGSGVVVLEYREEEVAKVFQLFNSF